MRLLIALLVLAAATAGFSCKGTRRAKREQLVQNQDSLLYGSWYRSYEDDKGDGSKMTWRPDTYKFPPSRGREGMAFLAGGKFSYLAIAPTDGTEEKPGTWGWSGPKTLRLSLEDGTQYVLVIESLTREKLVGRLDRQ